METCNNRNRISRYYDLYLYPRCRSVRRTSNDGYRDHQLGSPQPLLRSDHFAKTVLLPALPLSSTNATPITGTWNPATIGTATAGTTTYTFTPDAGQCATTATMDVVITNQITPTFAQIGPLCQNSTAPVLPASSTNGISGTWSPAMVSTATVGTVTYTFTPDSGQCATTATMDVVITNQITPTFAQIGPLCQNSTAPVLPASSTNGISGTWSPATVSTATVGTVTYTFTPDAGQCATTATMEVVITNQITPTFTQIGPLCQNSTAPTLPLSSTNATPITGTWNLATIGTTTAGTTTYTFTPDAAQCAAAATMDIVVTTSITPTFAQIGPLCQNGTAPALPLSSTNATPITGTWNPATIGTTTAGTTTYTFTPDAGQCAAVVTMDIVVSTSVVPTFTPVGSLCINSTAPMLPLTSSNGISGTWSPATISTATTGKTTYTFTPDAGQCATTATMDVLITNQITPTFTPLGPLCQNSTAPLLPASSTNSITGTWSPATISTATAGTTTYTFTPDAGQCAAVATMDIVVTTSVVPTFTAIGPLCQNSTAPVLPASSTNSITGTWSPATIENTTAGTTTYTFTPDAGQCATTSTMEVVVTNQITPIFTQIGPLCQNSTAPTLQSSSTNATPITGTWNPATIGTITVGTTTYTFTPDAGQCAAVATMEIVVTNSVVPTFTKIGPLCQNSTAPTLPLSSTNATPITGTWSPATINTTTAGTTTYTFTPDAGQCAAVATMEIVVTNSVVPTFTADRTTVPEFSTAPVHCHASSSNAIPYHRNMESSHGKYLGCRDNDLYLSPLMRDNVLQRMQRRIS